MCAAAYPSLVAERATTALVLTVVLAAACGSPAVTAPAFRVRWTGASGKAIIIVADARDARTVQLVDDPAFKPAGTIELLDVTFDGLPDLLVPISAGCTGNCWVAAWPYDPASRRFVPSRSMSRLANVEIVDHRRRLLKSTECGGLACALFTAKLLAVDGTEARVVAEFSSPGP